MSSLHCFVRQAVHVVLLFFFFAFTHWGLGALFSSEWGIIHSVGGPRKKVWCLKSLGFFGGVGWSQDSAQWTLKPINHHDIKDRTLEDTHWIGWMFNKGTNQPTSSTNRCWKLRPAQLVARHGRHIATNTRHQFVASTENDSYPPISASLSIDITLMNGFLCGQHKQG